jgi:citronellyl-CoA dehydrogenase
MLFTTEHDEVRRTLQRFIASEVNPHVDAWEEAGRFPAHELFKKMGDLGLLGLNKPVEYGGMGLDYSYAILMPRNSAASPAAACPWASASRPTWRRRRSPASATMH